MYTKEYYRAALVRHAHQTLETIEALDERDNLNDYEIRRANLHLCELTEELNILTSIMRGFDREYKPSRPLW